MDKPLFLRSNYLYVSGLIILVAGMPVSLFLMSISQFILAGSFLLEGNVTEKFRRFLSNKAALLIAGIWLMHLVGLLWTTDVLQGLNDIRIKLPLLVLTIIIAGSDPLSKKQFHWVLACFVASVMIGTLVSMAVLTGIIQRDIIDIRDVFIFKISHIRFALFTCIAVFVLIYFIFSRKEKVSLPLKILFTALALWFFCFLFIVESLTGLSICIAVLFLYLIFYAWKRLPFTGRAALLTGLAAAFFCAFFFLNKLYHEYDADRIFSISLDAKTAQGNPYTFILSNTETENGYPIYTYMCDEELKRSWNRRSKIDFDSLDRKHQSQKFTLIRFLASKGLRKDSAAMAQLSDEEIRSIENGITNVNYQSPSVKSRLLEVAWELQKYSNGGDPNGHSIMQRIESWKASLLVIKSNLFFGVGTGDLPNAMYKQYPAMNSKLDAKHYLRCHNQYLAIGVAFGIAGLAFFLFALFYQLPGHQRNYFYVVFFLTILFSMLTEDTLETQPGATFFAFFNAFFLFAQPGESAGRE